ncbi:MAG: 3-oxoacyl-[acyl-carrier-protein] reductase [Alphaproteobacteria bacterium]|nr:3-oxoacyl-[acyl-carrier-protein] reductase [Alphaproteobacteria bacterium]
MLNFEGKTVLITGATGGIGRSICKLFQKQGAQLAIVGRDINKLNDFKQKELPDGDVKVYAVDLSNENNIADLVEKVEADCGKIDVLINNAGITQDNLSLKISSEAWHKVLDTNLTSSFLLSKAVLPCMLKHRFGRIINMTSVVGVIGNAGQTNYAASKAGLIGMSKSMALEIASRGITVNCLAPGFIKTPMTDVLPEKAKEKLLDNIPMAKMGNPEDVANAAVFLASDEAGYITGQTIHVNGGMAMI